MLHRFHFKIYFHVCYYILLNFVNNYKFQKNKVFLTTSNIKISQLGMNNNKR
jgi:hypothetical protein